VSRRGNGTVRKLKVVQVGVGGFGAYRRARMRETGLFHLAAAYDLNPLALDQAKQEDGARPCVSFKELLDTPGAEAMVVATGAKFHAEQAIAAMERGMHVFVEKPLCATPSEMRDLIAAQKRTARVVGVGHNDHRHDGKSCRIMEMIEEAEFGKIAAFEMTTAHSGGLEIRDGEWRGDPGKNPGGMLFQCGVHALHELMFFFGPIRRVTAGMRYDVHTTLTADVAHCILEFESGALGTLSAYHVTPYRHTLNIYGTKMSLYVDERAGAYGDAPYYAVQYRKRGEAEPHQPISMEGPTDPCGNLRSFHQAVTEGTAPYPSLMDGARAVAVVFAAEESARTGHAVSLRERYPELAPA
jgi:predicted dehydrogenase